MRPARRRRHAALIGLVVVGSCAALLGCSDGTPGFCGPLAEAAPLEDLRSALEEGDLARAGSEADRFTALAGDAPEEIRTELRALADGVQGIVSILRTDRATQDGSAGATTEDPGRARDDLNRRLGALVTPAADVRDWAQRECGLDLGAG
jgi:hypothetical protein